MSVHDPTEAEMIDMVLAGDLSIEAIEDEGVRALAIRAWQDKVRRQDIEDRMARLTNDVAIVPFVQKADDIEAAMARLQGDSEEAPVWETFDGYLFVHGYPNAEVQDALVGTRRRGPG